MFALSSSARLAVTTPTRMLTLPPYPLTSLAYMRFNKPPHRSYLPLRHTHNVTTQTHKQRDHLTNNAAIDQLFRIASGIEKTDDPILEELARNYRDIVLRESCGGVDIYDLREEHPIWPEAKKK
ncbi:MAG: hypothetical protein KDK65_01715 [Chlamydiia bacterium]|nr:hypothetical protein [Chlamydiia bacterium]